VLIFGDKQMVNETKNKDIYSICPSHLLGI